MLMELSTTDHIPPAYSYLSCLISFTDFKFPLSLRQILTSLLLQFQNFFPITSAVWDEFLENVQSDDLLALDCSQWAYRVDLSSGPSFALACALTMGSLAAHDKFCWVTLVTKPSYLPGATILAQTLDKHHSKYPLLVLYTESIGPQAAIALAYEAKRIDRMRLHYVDHLLPRKEQQNTGIDPTMQSMRWASDDFTKCCCQSCFQHPLTDASCRQCCGKVRRYIHQVKSVPDA